MKSYDVIIVGAGPVGSYIASQLAEKGHSLAVVEQKAALGEKICCAGIISPRCVDSFALGEDIILRRANSAKLFSPSGRLLRVWRPETQACIIDRAGLDASLAKQAQGRGVDYWLGSLVSSISIGDDGVRVEAVGQGERLDFKARAVVIATGFGSSLTQQLGLGKAGDSVMGGQVEVMSGVEEVEVYFGREVAPGFFGWLVPTSPDKALVGLLSRRRPEFYLPKLLSSLEAEGKIASAGTKPSYRGILLKPLAKTYGDRLLVVGGAAGQVKPTTGGGIYYGLLCADIAVAILHQALGRGDLSARSLAGYERGWRRRLGRELRMGYWARKLYEHMSDAQIDRAFDIIKSSGIDDALLKAEEVSFDWHGEVILRLVGHQLLARAIGVVKIPFRSK
ncbi:MAG: NAD(P)/FAD-dependent oxidoreductase [Dehalococcoidia bacterium]|nr:MAG: NAD(P)/FAD-dependent oxidoreductase [Dehalococcoidia bacterium]